MLRLVPFAERHLTERYVSWLNDPVVTRYSEQRHRRHTLASCRAYWESIAAPDRFWAIELDGRHIGNITATVDARNGVADLAILIGERDAQGHGHGLTAWVQAIRESGARKITAGTMATNVPMLRLFEKSGMQIAGRRARHYLWEGQEVDMVMAECFPDRG